MIELTVGTRFYYNSELCEVSSEQCWHCTGCVFNDDLASCRMFVCEQATRHDGMGVFAKRVERQAKTTVSGAQLQHQDLRQILQL